MVETVKGSYKAVTTHVKAVIEHLFGSRTKSIAFDKQSKKQEENR